MQRTIDTQLDIDLQQKSLVLKKFHSNSIKTLNFSPRTQNALLNNKISNLGDLLSSNYQQLSRIPSLGKKSLFEIFDKVNIIDEEYFSSINILGFSKNTLEILNHFNISTINELKEFDVNQVLTFKNVGMRAFKQITKFLKSEIEEGGSN